MIFPYCGKLIYEGSLESHLKGNFVKSPDGSFIQTARKEFSPRVMIVSPLKTTGRIHEATVYVFSTIEGIARESLDELKELTGGYMAPTPEEAVMETARELAKALEEKFDEVFR